MEGCLLNLSDCRDLLYKSPTIDNMNGSTNGTAKASFRQYLPDITTPRFRTANEQSPYQYVEAFQTQKHPRPLYDLAEAWEELLNEPFTGVTNDGMSHVKNLLIYVALNRYTGKVQSGLFDVQNTDINISRICKATNRVITTATPEQRSKLLYPLNAREWRCWSNPEFLLRPFGLRLEEISEELAGLVLDVLEVTLSPEGYQKALAAMCMNQFLGDLVELSNIMNKFSYNFLVFGQPSTTEAWGE